MTTGAEGGHKYLSTRIFYDGVEQSLAIYFKDKFSEEQIKSNTVIAIKGHFREEVSPFTLTLLEASQVEIPNENSWLGFIVQKLLTQNIPAFRITEYPEGFAVSTFLENYQIWFDISIDKLTLKKAEFGRLLPLEKPNMFVNLQVGQKGISQPQTTISLSFYRLRGTENKKKNTLYHTQKTT